MANGGRSGGLQTIFSFFLGLMVTAFVGVGVYTFHPPPDKEFEGRIRNLATDTTIARFVVITAALAITLGLGYIRFVRRRAIPAPPATPGTAADGLPDIERRLRDLEGRMSAAADALGTGGDARDVDQRR